MGEIRVGFPLGLQLHLVFLDTYCTSSSFSACHHITRRSHEPRGHSVCRSDLACQLLMTSKSEFSFLKDKAVVSLFLFWGTEGQEGLDFWCARVTSSVLTRKWVLYGALVFLILLCMYSIISDVTYGLAFTSVKCTWHLVFHVCVNRCNQEGVGILLLLMSKSIFVFRPSHLECVHHFPNFPLSPAASIRCWHLLCYSLIAFQGELAQNTPAVPNNPKWCECVYSIGSAWLWFQTLDTLRVLFLPGSQSSGGHLSCQAPVLEALPAGWQRLGFIM